MYTVLQHYGYGLMILGGLLTLIKNTVSYSITIDRTDVTQNLLLYSSITRNGITNEKNTSKTIIVEESQLSFRNSRIVLRKNRGL